MLTNTCENTLTIKSGLKHTLYNFRATTQQVSNTGRYLTLEPNAWVENTDGTATIQFNTEVAAPLQWFQQTSAKHPDIEFTLVYYSGYIDYGDTLTMLAGVRVLPTKNIFRRALAKLKRKPRPKKNKAHRGGRGTSGRGGGAGEFFEGVGDVLDIFN